MTNELQLLIEALEKKKNILEDILQKSKDQNDVASLENFDADRFDLLVDDKAELLQQMESIDDGFDAVYHRIKDEMLQKKDDFKTEIARMQQLIRETIDLGAQIHTTEVRTKEKLGVAIERSRQDLRRQKQSSQTVMDYYKANSQLNYTESYFIDQKK